MRFHHAATPAAIPLHYKGTDQAPPARPAVVATPTPALEASFPTLVLAFCDRHRHVLLAAVAALYLLAFNGQWRVEPDSALYLTIGRNLAQGRGYTYHGIPNDLAFPGFPVFLAGMFKVFGRHAVFAAQIALLLMAMATLGLTYRLMWLFVGRPTAVLVTAMVGLTHALYKYTVELRNDLPFLMGIMAVLAGYEAVFHRRPAGEENGAAAATSQGSARWYDWALLGLGLAVAVVTRPTMQAFVPIVLFATVWGIARGTIRRRPAVISLLVVLLAGAAFVLLDPRTSANGRFGGYEEFVLSRVTHFRETLTLIFRDNLRKLFEPTMAESVFGHELGPGVNTVAGLVLLGFTFVFVLRRRPLWGLWVVATIGTVLLVFPLDRYFLPVLPILALAWWQGIVWVHRRLARLSWSARLSTASPAAVANVIAALLLATWVGPNLVKMTQVVLEQRRVPFLKHYKVGRYAPVKELADGVNRLVEPHAAVLVQHKLGRILTYLSDRDVMEPRELTEQFKPGQGLYVILPCDDDPEEAQRIADMRLRLGPAIATVPRPHNKFPWTLHAATPAPPEAPASSP